MTRLKEESMDLSSATTAGLQCSLTVPSKVIGVDDPL